MYASGDLFDINGVRHPQMQSLQYGATGVFLDYEKYKSVMPNFQAEVRKKSWFNYMLNPDGTRYGLPGQNYDKDYLMEAWACNKTILDKHGVKVPETSDELMAAMKKLKAANPAVYPWIYVWEMTPQVDVFYSMFGKYDPSGMIYDETLKEWYYGPIDPRSPLKATLKYMNEMYKSNLFDPEQETHNVEQYLATAQKGLWGFTFMYVNMTRPGQMRKNVADYVIAPMFVPRGPSGAAYPVVTIGYDQMNYWGIMSNSKTKNPELVCAILDWMFSPEATQLINWGVEGVTFKKNADGTKSFLPDIVTGETPNGTKKPADFALQNPIIPYAFISDVYSASLVSNNADSFALVKKVVDGLVSGRHTGPTFLASIKPLLTTEEGDKEASIINPIRTYVRENMLKFIKGERSFDTWDQYVADVKKLGDIDWVIKLYNSKKTIQRAPRDYSNYWK